LSISRANLDSFNTLTFAQMRGVFCHVKTFHLEFFARQIK
jgi:hypothetical protein